MFNPGLADEAAQLPTYNVLNSNNGLFAVQPAIAANGDLTYTPADDANGLAIVTVSVTDNGGVANDGDDTSPNSTFNIDVTLVNDEPAFTVGADEAVLEDAGLQTVAGHAT